MIVIVIAMIEHEKRERSGDRNPLKIEVIVLNCDRDDRAWGAGEVRIEVIVIVVECVLCSLVW